ncbi:MAG: hypothetical protein HW387_951 [Parachlamydiales bacterium]|nr:hypothetical protein [Parachlamydiales bacterium]
MKKYLFTGMIILLPVALTIWIVVFLFDFFTTPFVHIVEKLLVQFEMALSVSIPHVVNIFISRLISLILLCIFTLVLGVVARWIFIRNMIRATHSVMAKIPFIKTVFKVSRDVFSAIFSQDGKKAFQRPVMIPFPDYPNHSLGFVVGNVPHECQEKVNVPLKAIFSPTAPHPISGFLFLVEEKDVYSLDMTNEDTVKFLVSCGMIVPDNHDKQ